MLLGCFNFDSRCFPCVLLFLVSLGSFLTAFIGDAPFSHLLLVLRFVPVLWHWLVNLSDFGCHAMLVVVIAVFVDVGELTGLGTHS